MAEVAEVAAWFYKGHNKPFKTCTKEQQLILMAAWLQWFSGSGQSAVEQSPPSS